MDHDERRREEAARAQAALDAHRERTRIGEDQEDREEGARLRRRAREAQDEAMGNDW